MEEYQHLTLTIQEDDHILLKVNYDSELNRYAIDGGNLIIYSKETLLNYFKLWFINTFRINEAVIWLTIYGKPILYGHYIHIDNPESYIGRKAMLLKELPDILDILSSHIDVLTNMQISKNYVQQLRNN